MAMQEMRQERQPSRPSRGGNSVAARRGASPGRHNRGNRSPGSTRDQAERLAMGLGWFSIGLGLAELVAPHSVARVIGMVDNGRNCNMLRAFGLREITSGIGLLNRPDSAGWMWSRVAGDAVDLAALGRAMSSDEAHRGRLGAATAAVVGVTVLDVLCAQQLGNGEQASTIGRLPHSASGVQARQGIHETNAITVNKGAEDVYRAWRELEQLPRFMYYLESVRVIGDRRSHWKAKAPLGFTIEWDAELTEDRPNERLAWRSLPGSPIPNSGSVSFEPGPGGRGTVVRVEHHYDPPGGQIGATFAKLFGREPKQEVEDALRRFKAIMEVGEVVQSDATAKGWGSAQPRVDGRF